MSNFINLIALPSVVIKSSTTTTYLLRKYVKVSCVLKLILFFNIVIHIYYDTIKKRNTQVLANMKESWG